MKIYVDLEFKGNKIEALESLPYGIGAHYKYEGNRKEIIRTLPDTYTVGLGERDELRLHHIWDIARIAAEKVTGEINADEIYFYNIEKIHGSTPFNTQQITNAIVLGATTGLYRFDSYKAKKDPNKKIAKITVSDAYAYQKEADVIAKAYVQTRTMIEMAPNDFYPESACKHVDEMFAHPMSVYVDDYDPENFRRKSWDTSSSYIRRFYFTEKTVPGLFPSLWAVGRGAGNKPRMLVIEYKHPGTTFKNPIALVGKGICMDTGGDDSKPSDAKKNMRMDMAGAANVIGTMKTIVDLNIPVWVVAVCPFAINSPGPDAYTQEMVIGTYKNGPTTVIRHTDAEGRVVLSDAVRFAALEWNPKYIIELSTLTGAARTAIGNWGRTVAISNHKPLEDTFLRAVERAGQRVTFLPLDEEALEAMQDKESGADHNNIGSAGSGGAITGGAFVFLKLPDGTHMIHWDIAPTTDKPELRGQEIRTLIEFMKMTV
ncbi:MAG: M17 family peptidase N-terminal domain-containing protein [bacterium]|nr:M17 family peptidase N-terminal domain-containing protein [bacterium]